MCVRASDAGPEAATTQMWVTHSFLFNRKAPLQSNSWSEYCLLSSSPPLMIGPRLVSAQRIISLCPSSSSQFCNLIPWPNLTQVYLRIDVSDLHEARRSTEFESLFFLNYRSGHPRTNFLIDRLSAGDSISCSYWNGERKGGLLIPPSLHRPAKMI